MKIAVTMYTLRKFVQTPKDMVETFNKVKRIGYNNVQLSGLGQIDTKELKRILDDVELFVCATHVSFEKLKNQFDETIEEHKILGCSHIAIASIPSNMRNEDGYKTFAEECSVMGEKMIKEGIDLSYHNHAFELVRFGDKTGLDIIYDESDKKFLLAEIDTYWVQFGGGDPAYWIKKMKKRIKIVHFKDMGIIDNKPTMFEVGEGNLNWKEIVDACRYSGAEYLVVEQDECQRDPFESVRISFQNMVSMGLKP